MATKFKRGFLKANGGAAAIESVFIIPFLCVLYFGSEDLTSMIKFSKQMTDVATVVSDTVAQYQNTITRAQITDIENTIGLLVQPNQAANVQVDVYSYYSNNGTITKRWSTKSPNGTACVAPTTTNFANMMVNGNDVILAVACMTYTPWVGSFMGGTNMLGSSTFTLTRSIASVPYNSKTITCVTTAGGSTACSG